MTQFVDAFSEDIWKQTYKDHTDNTVDDTFRRVANAIASVESTEEKFIEWAGKFYDLLSNFKGTCGGRTYANAGTEFQGTTLLNCFVAPRTINDLDSLDKIINDVKNQALTLKSEGGWGQNFCIFCKENIYLYRNGKEMFVPIEEVIKGDFVYSDDGNLHLVEEVLHAIKDDMVTLTLETGNTITCTIDHPFYVNRNGIKCWVMAEDILETDDLINL
jgi:ribonucleotide reductase alpha subunit